MIAAIESSSMEQDFSGLLRLFPWKVPTWWLKIWSFKVNEGFTSSFVLTAAAAEHGDIG